MINEKIAEESAVLINMAYLERRYIDKTAKNTQQLCSSLLEIEINQGFSRKPETVYRSIMRDIFLNRNNILGDEAFQNKLDLYKTYKKEYGLSKLNDTQLYMLAKRDYATDIKKNLIPMLKSVYDDSQLEKLNSIEKLISERKTVTDKAELQTEERKNVYAKIEELGQTCKTIIPSEKIRNKYKAQSTPRGTTLKATFEDGYVDISEDNGPKDASFLVKKSFSTNPPTLHICFRGTDNKAKSVVSYFANEYPNMDRQYRKIRGVLNAIIAEQIAIQNEDYPGQPLQVHFSGHSLGAAMAERAIESHKNSKRVTYTATVFANPGSKHYLQKVVDAADAVDNQIFKTCFRNKAFLSLGSNIVTRNIEKSYDLSAKAAKFPLFLTVGLTSIVVSTYRKAANFLDIENHMPEEATEAKLNTFTFLPKILGKIAYKVARIYSDIVQDSLTPINNTTNLILDNFTETKKNDSRMMTINHKADYIPAIGSKLFDHATKGIVILDNKLTETENKGLIKSKLTFDYHNAYNYGNEVIKMIKCGKFKEISQSFEKKKVCDNIEKMRLSLSQENENKLKPA